ncbi:fumarate hydratase [Thermotoga sp. SG1]|uniref:fumarate hydratase n=1 Tax=Thermotoga sp. SG1 TaxID=126739 RepID=UPI000C783DF1|nr:fumarate hydratase [Thermotoga sp. SG1]PLV56672.1 fumarate hydratase [Thermotoga sp. SG1]
MIRAHTVLEKVKKAIVEANVKINEEIREIIEEYEGPFSDIIKENYRISKEENLPLCQDTGMVEFFVFLGHKTVLEEPIEQTLNKAVEEVYREYPFRFSVVSDPLFDRINTETNTPAVVHLFQVEGNKLEIRFLVKGGGSENLSVLRMMNPTSGIDRIKEFVVEHIKEHGAKACPPLHVGIGIGGTADKAVLLSKLALTRDFKERNEDPRYAELERELENELNLLGIGFQGLGKGKTVYSVHIEHFPTHIATLPVAISVDCYLCRKGKVIVEG